MRRDDELDPVVVQAFVDGDGDALRAVVDRFAGPLFAVASSMTSDRELAAEAVQTSFVKAWRSAHTFDVARPLAPWLYSIARRTTIDAIRREGKPWRGGHQQLRDVAVHTIGMERTWEVFEVRRALDRLPEDEREVLRLVHLEGFSQREVADIIGVPLGTVKSRCHRAVRRLTEFLRHVVDDGTTAPHDATRRTAR